MKRIRDAASGLHKLQLATMVLSGHATGHAARQERSRFRCVSVPRLCISFIAAQAEGNSSERLTNPHIRLYRFRGCDKEALNYANQTPYQVAVIAGNLELAEIIQAHRPEEVGEYFRFGSGTGRARGALFASFSLAHAKPVARRRRMHRWSWSCPRHERTASVGVCRRPIRRTVGAASGAGAHVCQYRRALATTVR